MNKFRHVDEEKHRQLMLKLLEAIPTNCGIDADGAYRHLNNDAAMRKALRVFLQLHPSDIISRLEYGMTMTAPRKVLVDTSGGWHKLISRGDYLRVSADITPKTLPIERLKRSHSVEVVLFRFQAPATLTLLEAAKLVKAKGWQLADLALLATIGAEKRNLRSRRIIALGQERLPCYSGEFTGRGIAYFPVLKLDDVERRPILTTFDNYEGVRRNTRVLAYRYSAP